MLVVGGDKNDGGRLPGGQGPGDFQAVELRHVEVQKHQVRLLLKNGINGIGAIVALADDLDIGLLGEEFAEAITRQRFVVHNQGAKRHTEASSCGSAARGGTEGRGMRRRATKPP